MGGMGSGRWKGVECKPAVEGLRSLDINMLVRTGLNVHHRDSICCRHNLIISLEWIEAISSSSLLLRYSIAGVRMEYAIPVDKSKQKSGGFRYRFLCPVNKDGVSCGRRCEKLYIRPGARAFGCRICLKLTYNSCKHSRRYDSVVRQLTRETGMPKELFKLLFTKRGMRAIAWAMSEHW